MASTATDVIDGVSSDAAIKIVRGICTSNVTLSGLSAITTIEGSMTPVDGDRFLMAGQTDATTRLIYQARTGAWTLAPESDGARDLRDGTMVKTQGGVIYHLTTSDPIVPGTTSLTWERVATTLLGDGSLVSVESLVALKGLVGMVDGQVVHMRHYYALSVVAAGGGGGDVEWRSTSSATANDGTVILPTGHVGNGRWLALGEMNALRWGLKGDGVTTDTTRAQAMVDAAADGDLLTFNSGKNFKIGRVVFTSVDCVVVAHGASFTLTGNQAGFVVKGTVSRFLAVGGKTIGDGADRDADSTTAQIAWLIGNEAGASVQNATVGMWRAESCNVGFKAAYGTSPNTKLKNIRFIESEAVGSVGVVGGMGYGFQFAQCDDSSIIDCFADQCQRHGMYVSEGRNYRVIGGGVSRNRDGLAAGTLRGGLSVSRSRNVTIAGLVFDNNNDSAINIDVDAQGLSPDNVLDGVTVSGCVFNDSDINDITVGTTNPAVDGIPKNVVITGNTMTAKSGNADSAVAVRCGDHIVIRGNNVDYADASASVRAIALIASGGVTYTKDVTIDDNDIYSANYGIQVEAAILTGSNRFKIENNRIVATTAEFEFIGGEGSITNNSFRYKRSNGKCARTYTSAGASNVTVPAGGVDTLIITASGALTVEVFSGGAEGDELSIYFSDANTTIKNSTMYLPAPFVSTANDVLKLLFAGGQWRQAAPASLN